MIRIIITAIFGGGAAALLTDPVEFHYDSVFSLLYVKDKIMFYNFRLRSLLENLVTAKASNQAKFSNLKLSLR